MRSLKRTAAIRSSATNVRGVAAARCASDAVDIATRELVGSCAFKSSPTPDGNVEIAYFTYPPFEGKGYATEMARALVALALKSGVVRTIVAHTLPETNASTRVLQKTGMTFVGEVIDPDDGRVWRWELAASKG